MSKKQDVEGGGMDDVAQGLGLFKVIGSSHLPVHLVK